MCVSGSDPQTPSHPYPNPHKYPPITQGARVREAGLYALEAIYPTPDALAAAYPSLLRPHPGVDAGAVRPLPPMGKWVGGFWFGVILGLGACRIGPTYDVR